MQVSARSEIDDGSWDPPETLATTQPYTVVTSFDVAAHDDRDVEQGPLAFATDLSDLDYDEPTDAARIISIPTAAPQPLRSRPWFRPTARTCVALGMAVGLLAMTLALW